MQRWVILTLAAVLTVASAAWSAPAKKDRVYSGVVLDNACAKTNSENLAAAANGHTKECALKPESQASGYSLYTSEGQLIPFTKKSKAKIVAFLQQPDSSTEVEVTGKRTGKYLQLVGIKNKN